MKKVLLTVMSGVLIGLISFNVLALDRNEMIYSMERGADIGNDYASNALSAFERKIKSEMAAGNRVSLTGFGTYKPEKCETINGKEKCKIIKGAKTVSQANLINAMRADSDLTKAGAGRALAAYEGRLHSELKKGGQFNNDGEEVFSTKVRAARTKLLANGEVKNYARKVTLVHNEDPSEVRYRFTPAKALRNSLNNR